MVDTVAIIRQLLLEDPAVQAITEGRVFADEIPSLEYDSMPRNLVVVMYAGPSDSRANTTPISRARIDTWSWAKSFHDAAALDAAIYDALKSVIRRVVDHALIHAISPLGAPSAFKDAEAGWPAYMRSATAIIDERAI